MKSLNALRHQPNTWLQRVVFFLILISASLSVQADESPRDIVVGVTDKLQALMKTDADKLNTDPAALYESVSEILDPVVAFDYIARGVMGQYGKDASPEQVSKFSKSFHHNLISTYTKGMAVYANRKIQVLPLDDKDKNSPKVSVVQKVQADEGYHTVVYSMALSRKTNEWKLLNVIINGVNLGTTFRSQFAQAMRQKGDLDTVINEWDS